MAESKILKGIDAIRLYIDPKNPPSADMIKIWIRQGMRARLIGREWYSHKEHIDNFFLLITKINNSTAPDELFEDNSA